MRGFPTKAEASNNLSRALGALKKPWVVIAVIALWALTLALTWGMGDNTIALSAASAATVAIVTFASFR
jgi:hypothetical protein